MKGLLCFEGTPEELLVFICPVCKKEHAIYVSSKGPYQKTWWKDSFSYSINVWKYTFTSKGEILVSPNMVLHEEHGDANLVPSIDLCNWCSFHSTYEWSVECIIIRENQYRTPQIEEWLVQ